MKIALTTLGCPGWDLTTVIARAREYGYDGVDFRGLGDALDVTVLPAFGADIAQTKRMFDDAGLAVCGISTSLSLCAPEKREAAIEEAKRTISAAHGLGSSLVRVFGNGDVKTHTRAQLAEFARDTMAELLALDGADAVEWVFETHDHWIKSDECLLLLDTVANPALGVLWDIGHTPRVGGETPEETVKALGRRIRYAHIKDAVYDPSHELAMKDGWRYVPPGTGQLPLARAVELLRGIGYDGWVLFEHEKRWHPELPEPEDAFPQFVRWIRPLIG